MTDILCHWLNEDVKLSRPVDPDTLTDEFSNGYFLGEILYIYGLQNDFASFSQSSTSDSKLNNFTRIEPTIALLGIPFDTNVAKDIISRKPGVATRLLYQLFISLGKKTKKNLTGVAMETMRPAGPARLSNIESGLYKERLKTLVPRQVDLDFDDLIDRYHQQQKNQEEMAIRKEVEEKERLQKYMQYKREEGLQRSKQIRAKQDLVMEKIKEATVMIPKPPKTKKEEKLKYGSRKSREAEEVYNEIDHFESNLKSVLPPISPLHSDTRDVISDTDVPINNTNPRHVLDSLNKPESNTHYINKIRDKLNQDTQARMEREKRRRKVLVEQMKANESQEDAKREEMLVNRLMRQSQMERRIAVQLMNVRHEKKIIKENRLFREKQFTERRMKDFTDALEKEAEMCQQAEAEYQEEIKKNKELHAVIAEERARKKYEKHYRFCREVLSSIIDFSCKVGEYRELTEKALPAKLVREWKAMIIDAIPFYSDTTNATCLNVENNEQPSEEQKEELLDEEDFEEYQLTVGEWGAEILAKEESCIKQNPILGHILKRLFDIVYPPPPPVEKPKFPPCPIKACVIGKYFCGKTTAIQHITATHRVVSLDSELLLKEAVNAFHNTELEEITNIILPEETKETLAQEQSKQSTDNSTINTKGNVDQSHENQGTVEADTVQSAVEGQNSDKTIPDTTVDTESRAGLSDQTPNSVSDVEQNTLPITSPKESTSIETVSNLALQPQLTKRAKLGEKAFQYMKKGKPVPDFILVDIIAQAIREIPDGTGWILDGFPATVNQAKLLEKVLTGYEATPSPTKSMKSDIKKSRKSRLANDPAPAPQAPPLQSCFDIVIFFDLDDAIILERAEGRKVNPETLEEFHEKFKPPPEGSYTGVLGHPEIQTVVDPAFDREQVQCRLTGFQDTWPKLEKWFNKFNVLSKLSVDKPPGDVFLEVERLIEETLIKINQQMQPEEEEVPVVADTPQPTEKVEEEIPKPEEPPAVDALPQAPSPTESTPQDGKGAKQPLKEQKSDTKKGGKKEGKREGRRTASPVSKKGKDKKERERSATPTKGRTTPTKEDRPSSKKGSRSPSPGKKSRPGSKSPRPGSKSGKRSKSPVKVEEPPPEPVPVVPEGPLPGSTEWEYVDQPVDEDIAQFLVPKWENIETTYIETCKGIFRQIREEREKIVRYFYNTRKGFVEFLKRPDTKQDFVEQWQKEHNAIDEDLREDEDAKAEYHERVEDLCVRLWDICDSRKEEAEQERQKIMTEGWVEDRTGILMNHYLSLMQVELSRYQDSCSLAKDYYIAMEGVEGSQKAKLLSSHSSDVTRIPLVELPKTTLISKESDISITQEIKPLSARGSRDRDRSKETKTPDVTENDEETKKRITLVPRRPKSSDSPTKEKKDKKMTPRKEKSEEKTESPVLILDNDEKILYETQLSILQIIEQQIAFSLTDDPTIGAKQTEEKEKDLQKTVSKGKKEKKGGRKSAGKSVSKAQLAETPPPAAAKEETTAADSEEEQKKKDLKEKALREYRAAIDFESQRLKLRIDLIKSRAASVITDLKGKADITYADMDDWLGKRFIEEVESIDAMAMIMRLAIESHEKIQDAIILQDKEFIVEIDLHTFKTPSPPPLPPPIEIPYKDTFTVVQLRSIFEQLEKTAPSGVISVKAFYDTLQDLAACTEGADILPDFWMNITSQQLNDISNLLSWDQENIDWRTFLIAAALPYPEMTNEYLMNLLAAYIMLDKEETGFIEKDDFLQIPLFDEQIEMPEPNVAEGSNRYDRLGNLQDLILEVFSKSASKSGLVDYRLMLQYFSIHENPLDGFLRSLAVVTNKEMPNASELDVKPTEDGIEIEGKKEIPQRMLSAVRVNDLLQVFNLGQQTTEDTHRFATSKEFLSCMEKEKLAGIFNELGCFDDEHVPLHLLWQHPVMKEYINSCQKYKKNDIRNVFKAVEEDLS